jgi:hypothetical protein
VASVAPAATPLRRSEPAEGTPLGDLCLLAAEAHGVGGVDGRAQLAALERTVDRIQWYPRNPRVRRALAERVEPPGGGAQAKRRELRAAVYLVLAERGRPQAHRFGRSWLIGDDGRLARVAPDQLEATLFWSWFCDEVRKAAEASLLGEPYPADDAAPTEHAGSTTGNAGHESPSSNTSSAGEASAPTRHLKRAPKPRLVSIGSSDMEALADPSPGPLDALLAQERRREAGETWRAAITLASGRQRQILEALARAAAGTPPEQDGEEGSPPTSAPSLAEVARQLGIAPSTARVQWKRLVERLRRDGRLVDA